jgi:outer membrane protein assembly factor BamB
VWRNRLIKVVKLGAAAILLVAAVLAILVHGFGMRVSRGGSGMRPIVTFGSRSAHFDRLEAHRASQRTRDQKNGAPAIAGSATPESAPAPSAAAQPLPASASATTADPARAAAPHVATAGPPDSAAKPEEQPSPQPSAGANSPTPSGAGGRSSAYWTGFRGPRRDGIYTQQPVRTTWPPEGLTPLWKQPAGEGYASFAIANGRAFTIEQRREKEVVVAYDVATGRELWTNAWDAHFSDSMGGDGPRATPTWHQGKVYALGAEGELRCLDAETGKLLWRHDILKENDASNLSWAMAGSPLVVDDKVIVLPGGRRGRSVVAYHKDSGAPLWAALDDKQAYTAPMVATLAGRRQLIVVSAARAAGLTLEDGRLLWEYPWVTDFGVNAAQPIVVGTNRVFLSAGYGHGAAVVELTAEGEGYRARTAWQNTRMKNKFTSSVLHQGHIYGLDEAILACIDASTGELKWKGGRYGYGQLVLASGHLILLAENGELVLVAASPDSHQELARFAALEGKTWNHPALSDGYLLVRNSQEMAAFDLRSPVPLPSPLERGRGPG